jgi:hypothetical protein
MFGKALSQGLSITQILGVDIDGDWGWKFRHHSEFRARPGSPLVSIGQNYFHYGERAALGCLERGGSFRLP